ncbi:molybdopterin biosynthesis protein MoeA [Chryseobacterium sp. Leaf180]|uniref:molybdopterin molybdotransferase MoeA n=1 Tax=Chryseobacterium sp. Leaf180 TaxID=1736289 RepID=UPI0006F2F23A|nr:molybdopterin molybdotransferase MoeA [Chryseobacterium sp. Leaf180]KQR94815.1 molybdopterin biosynthesis protein MoeA [Chryseobacterium sp. Leaf180]
MITVEEADRYIFDNLQDFGTEETCIQNALGRVLAEDILADRDLPPFDRALVDGVAIDFKNYSQNKIFYVKDIQAAGQNPFHVSDDIECVEIMTGAAVSETLNTVIRYEDISISDGKVTVNVDIKEGQNIHKKGRDKKFGDVLVLKNQRITASIIGIAASVGKIVLKVKKLPKVIIISTGDEIVLTENTPNNFQIRSSNSITIQSVLKKYNIDSDIAHLNDDLDLLKENLAKFLHDYDVILLSGGVSMGKFDFLPQAFEDLKIKKIFHKIKQKPGKPFWFGSRGEGKKVFAFPGNPVSVFLCLHRYFLPWLENSLGLKKQNHNYAILENDIHFSPNLQYFAQVVLKENSDGTVSAKTVDTNGSGDFSHLAETDAFMEFPSDKNEFKKGEVFKIWRYNQF